MPALKRACPCDQGKNKTVTGSAPAAPVTHTRTSGGRDLLKNSSHGSRLRPAEPVERPAPKKRSVATFSGAGVWVHPPSADPVHDMDAIRRHGVKLDKQSWSRKHSCHAAEPFVRRHEYTTRICQNPYNRQQRPILVADSRAEGPRGRPITGPQARPSPGLRAFAADRPTDRGDSAVRPRAAPCAPACPGR